MGKTETAWREEAENSILLEAVSHWREDAGKWFEWSYSRLPETLRVNPLTNDSIWIEEWLERVGARRISWFNGPGSAWEMPFQRGSAQGDVRVLLNALHETGRITRQEAVSMLPVLALDPSEGDVVLDLCASPGSKTTQICEHLGDSGAVIANEVVSGRINTLVSNIQRQGARSAIVVQHDGRHIPKVPGVGFDRVLVDVPCTGSGTTRKNPEVWRKWLPSSGVSMHRLQHDLLRRAVAVTKPGGRVVYSTCSLDPVENEAVVARILSAGGVKLVELGGTLGDVPSEPGMNDWPLLGDDGRPTKDSDLTQFGPPEDEEVSAQMSRCLRVWNDSIEGGGFFLAVLEKVSNVDASTSEIPRKVVQIDETPDPDSCPRPIDEEWACKLEEFFGVVPSSLWIRGKSLLWSTDEVREVWESDRTKKSGRLKVLGGRWRPLKVIHLGLITARLRKGNLERVVSKGAQGLLGVATGPFLGVDPASIDSILLGFEPVPEEVSSALVGYRGSKVLFDASGSCLPVWVGSRVTAMASKAERTVLRATRGLAIVLEEED